MQPAQPQGEPGPYGGPPAGPREDERNWSDGFGDPDRDGPPPRGAKVARPGVLILVAFLVQAVIIAALENQWVAKKVIKWSAHGGDKQYFTQAAYSFQWRTSAPGGSDTFHIWLGQYVLIGVLVVLTALLILILNRGPISFDRVFFGTWLAVLGAAVVGAIVRGGIVRDQTPLPKASKAAFGPSGPIPYVVVGALALGFVVALVTAIVAMISRKTLPAPAPVYAPAGGPPPYREPEQPEPFFGSTAGAPFGATTAFPRDEQAAGSASSAGNTSRLPKLDKPGPIGVSGAGAYGADDQTTAFERPRGGAGAAPDAASDDATTQYPRYTDDPSPSQSPAESPATAGPDDRTGQLPTSAAGSAGTAAEEPRRPDRNAADPDGGDATQAMPAPAGTQAPGPDGEAPRPESEAPRPGGEAPRPDSGWSTPARSSGQSPAPQAASSSAQPSAQPPGQPSGDAARTSVFPRPPDDEDLGHQPDPD